MTERTEIKERLAQEDIEFLLVQFVDMTGAPKVKMVPVTALDDALDEGAGFAGASIWGLGQGPHSHDMLARIDLDSYARLSWQPNTVRFASDLFVDGESYPYCSRTNLQRVLADARQQGYVFNVGMEPEHFLLARDEDGSIRPWDPDGVDSLAKPCYDFRSMSPAMAYLQELTLSLNSLGWGVYQCDHEDANGQFEVNFDYADALTTSDRIIFFKMATSQIAKKHGAIASHMPKPFADRTGQRFARALPSSRCRVGRQSLLGRRRRAGLGLFRAGLSLPRRHFAPRARPVRGLQPDGELLQAPPARRWNLFEPFGFYLDAGVYHLRRQQPHADDPHGRRGTF